MTGRVGLVVYSVGQNGVEGLWIYADGDAEKSGDAHGHEHIEWGFLTAQTAVGAKEAIVGDFDPRVMQHTGRGKEHHKPHGVIVVIGDGRHSQRLGDKAAKKREGGYGRCADHAEKSRIGHRLVEGAEVGGLGRTYARHHGTHSHKEQRFVEDMGKGVRGRSIEG